MPKHLAVLALCLLLCGCSGSPKPGAEPEGMGIGIIPDSVLKQTARDVDEGAALFPEAVLKEGEPEPPQGSQRLPSIVKPYYLAMLSLDGKPLTYNSRQIEKGNAAHIYMNADMTAILAVTRGHCMPSLCDKQLAEAIEELPRADPRITSVKQVAEREYLAESNMGGAVIKIRLFGLPYSMQSWMFTVRGRDSVPQEWLDRLTPLIERERAEDAATLARLRAQQ